MSVWNGIRKPFISNTLYSRQGQVIQQQLDQSPNGLTRQFTYDASTLRLSNLSAGTTGPWNNLQNLSYAYASNGNITSLVDGVNSSQRQCFQYDLRNRVTGVFAAIKHIRQRLPFDLLGIDSDNGAEFINDELYRYTVDEKLTFTRGRVARKTPLAQRFRRTEELVGGTSNSGL